MSETNLQKACTHYGRLKLLTAMATDPTQGAAYRDQAASAAGKALEGAADLGRKALVERDTPEAMITLPVVMNFLKSACPRGPS